VESYKNISDKRDSVEPSNDNNDGENLTEHSFASL
jgi:hypothetical protein